MQTDTTLPSKPLSLASTVMPPQTRKPTIPQSHVPSNKNKKNMSNKYHGENKRNKGAKEPRMGVATGVTTLCTGWTWTGVLAGVDGADGAQMR